MKTTSHILPGGVKVTTSSQELFLPFEDFPWFADQTVKAICNIEEPAPGHFYWPDLDVDLSEEIINNPTLYPEVASLAPSHALP